jgi:hypothetical protein
MDRSNHQSLPAPEFGAVQPAAEHAVLTRPDLRCALDEFLRLGLVGRGRVPSGPSLNSQTGRADSASA